MKSLNLLSVYYVTPETHFYSSEHYGAQVVEIEMGKKENRSADVKVMTMSDFVRLYKEKDVYMVVDILQEMMGKYNYNKSDQG